jgi:hypothetical protein
MYVHYASYRHDVLLQDQSHYGYITLHVVRHYVSMYFSKCSSYHNGFNSTLNLTEGLYVV